MQFRDEKPLQLREGERAKHPLRSAIFLINPSLELWNAKLKQNSENLIGSRTDDKISDLTNEYL